MLNRLAVLLVTVTLCACGGNALMKKKSEPLAAKPAVSLDDKKPVALD